MKSAIMSLSQKMYKWDFWDGTPLREGVHIAFDTETNIPDDPNEIPTLVLATASDGERNVVIHSDYIAAFIMRHPNRTWIGFNWAFDFWVVLQNFRRWSFGDAEKIWWKTAENNQLNDLMYLDMLIRLAQGSYMTNEGQDTLSPRNLNQVAIEYLGFVVSKTDPYRMRFDELIGRDWDIVDPGFFEYACRDAEVTWKLYEPMTQMANEIRFSSSQAGFTERDVLERYGLLSESIQTKASIALDDIRRRGIGVDLVKRDEVSKRIQDEIFGHQEWLQKNHHDLFKYSKSKKRLGELERAKKSGLPSVNQKYLMKVLEDIEEEENLSVARSAKTKKITTALGVWEDISHNHEFLQHWIGMQQRSKLYQFLVQLTKPVVHTSYRTLVRTGRTSAYSPNIQQMPREPWFRELFVPIEGYKLASIDYSAIELRTLSRVLEMKYGSSILGQVIRDGRDAHAYTAAMFRDMDYVRFIALKSSNPDTFREWRQQAKAINFGVPGGLGAEKLAKYARQNYSVDMSVKEAAIFRNRLIKDVYPELETYLSDTQWIPLAKGLECDVDRLRDTFRNKDGELSYYTYRTVIGIINGQTTKPDGSSYEPTFIQSVFRRLVEVSLSNDPTIMRRLWGGVQGVEHGSGELYYRLVLANQSVTTLTGRVRRGVDYTVARNTPFQGLAADGAKLALWRLIREGFKVVAFIHDEVVLEVKDEDEVKAAQKIMNEEMFKVVQFPIESEYVLSDHWSKP